MSAVSYRYLRPQRFDLDRCELVTETRGGVALRFEKYVVPGGEFRHWVMASRCHPDDEFVRASARAALDGRARRLEQDPVGRRLIDVGAFGAFDLDNAPVERTVEEVVAWSEITDWEQVPYIASGWGVASLTLPGWLLHLLKDERPAVGRALRELAVANRRQAEFARIYQAGVQALGLTARYAALDAASEVTPAEAATALAEAYAALDAASEVEPEQRVVPVAAEYAALQAGGGA